MDAKKLAFLDEVAKYVRMVKKNVVMCHLIWKKCSSCRIY